MVASDLAQVVVTGTDVPGPVQVEGGQRLRVAGLAAVAACLVAWLGTLATDAAAAAIAVPYLFTGALLVLRRPRNAVSWLLLVLSLSLDLIAFGGGATQAQVQAGVGLVPGWVAVVSFNATIGLLFLLTILFPLGRLPRGRWGRPARIAVWLLPFIAILVAFGPEISIQTPQGDVFSTPNPFGVLPDWPFLVGGTMVSQGALLALFVAGAGSMVVRLRTADAIERQQLLWVITSLIVLAAATVFALVTGAFVPWIVALALPPIAVAIAVLRYRLYEIDVVIRRTLVYVPLTAALAGMYAASIALFQRLFQAFTGNRSDGAVILSTLILAATFTPIKNALQTRVDRAFGAATIADRRLRAFVEAVIHSITRPDIDRTVREFLYVAVEAVGASGGAAYVQDGSMERLVGETLARSSSGVDVIIEDGQGRIGRVRLDWPADRRPVRALELAALDDTRHRLAAALRSDAEPLEPIGPTPGDASDAS